MHFACLSKEQKARQLEDCYAFCVGNKHAAALNTFPYKDCKATIVARTLFGHNLSTDRARELYKTSKRNRKIYSISNQQQKDCNLFSKKPKKKFTKPLTLFILRLASMEEYQVSIGNFSVLETVGEAVLSSIKTQY